MTYEIGCYGDGTLGHQHTRERCADILDEIAENLLDRSPSKINPPITYPSGYLYSLSKDLRREMSDDINEEINAEIALNYHAAQPKADWGWQEGNFGLWPIEEDQS